MQAGIRYTVSLDLGAPQLNSSTAQAAAFMLLTAARKLHAGSASWLSTPNATLPRLHTVFQPQPTWADLFGSMDVERRLLTLVRHIMTVQVSHAGRLQLVAPLASYIIR